MLELVADEPEPVARLQVVAGRRPAEAGGAAGDEATLPERGRGRGDPGRQVERDYEAGDAEAAASSSSKSGTSLVS